MAISNMLIFLEGWITLFGSMGLAYTVLLGSALAVVAAFVVGISAYKKHKGKSKGAFEVQDETPKQKKLGFFAKRRERRKEKELAKAQAQESARVEEVALTEEEKARVQAIEDAKNERIDAAGDAVIAEAEAEIQAEDEKAKAKAVAVVEPTKKAEEVEVEQVKPVQPKSTEQKEANKNFGGRILGE